MDDPAGTWRLTRDPAGARRLTGDPPGHGGLYVTRLDIVTHLRLGGRIKRTTRPKAEQAGLYSGGPVYEERHKEFSLKGVY